MTMGTRIVVMKDGFMQQVDTPINLYDYPVNQFVAGFIGTPQMNFFTGKLVGTKSKVYVQFGLEKIALPKDKVELIVNLDKYLNTDKEIVFGIRPEDIHDDERMVKESGNPVIEVKVDVVEALGSETLLYCKTRTDEVEEEGTIKSIVDDVSNLTAKVDSRSATKAGDTVKVALDIAHCHLFDKNTEITILARDVENKAVIEELQAKREQEEAEKAAAEAARLAEEEAKAAALLEKQRAKKAKKLGAAEEAPVEEVEAPVEETKDAE
jgi:multiple sugar transport system ATP-binding protein